MFMNPHRPFFHRLLCFACLGSTMEIGDKLELSFFIDFVSICVHGLTITNSKTIRRHLGSVEHPPTDRFIIESTSSIQYNIVLESQQNVETEPFPSPSPSPSPPCVHHHRRVLWFWSGAEFASVSSRRCCCVSCGRVGNTETDT